MTNAGRIALLARFYALVTATGAAAGGLAAALHFALDRLSHRHEMVAQAAARLAIPGWLLAPAAVALAVGVANWLVRRFADGQSGTGVPAVHQALRGDEPRRWLTALPAQFGAGVLALGAGLVLGREGPTVHMGSAAGALVSRCAPVDRSARRTLILAGAAAGLAAALHAPLAGIVFIIEDLREEFDFRFHSLQAVILAVVVATIVSGGIFGQQALLDLPDYTAPPLASLWLCLLLGLAIGALAVGVNRALVWGLRCFRGLPRRRPWTWSLGMGAMVGVMLWFMPGAVGAGERILLLDIGQAHALGGLLGLMALRTALLVASYSTGVPGGLYAPLLALGTLAGLGFGELAAAAVPAMDVAPGIYAIAAMGALFAASVRAPLTGIAITVELTGNFDLLLAIIVTALAATLVAEGLGGRPLFDVLARMTPTGEPATARPRIDA